MTVATTLKSQIDKLWLAFHTGGVTNPISVIEQISYLMFARLLDMMETKGERMAEQLGEPYENPIFTPERQHIRWSSLKNEPPTQMLEIATDPKTGLYQFFREELPRRRPLGNYLQNANCLIPTGDLFQQAVEMIHRLPLTDGDTKGDLYEYLLSKLSTAGIAGQFRTPRHIIRAMVEMIDPEPTHTVCDPACGTAGFLVATLEYLQQKYSTPELVTTDAEGNKSYPGDLLSIHQAHIRNHMVHGFDFDETMMRIAAMNLILHGIENPGLYKQDTLGGSFAEKHPKLAENRFDIILANPPFKGSIDLENVDPTLKSVVKTKKTELLFLALILRMLDTGGRAAVIVPDGVLFGASGAHVGVRKALLDKNQLDAVVSLPAGVFKPYAGVSTAVLFFTKGGTSGDVWFYDVEADGYSLDDKRTAQPEKDDLPDLVAKWKERDPKQESDRTAKHFYVPADEIRENRYDLSLNRYKETKYEEVDYDPPKEILGRMRKLEEEILADIDELEGMLG